VVERAICRTSIRFSELLCVSAEGLLAPLGYHELLLHLLDLLLVRLDLLLEEAVLLGYLLVLGELLLGFADRLRQLSRLLLLPRQLALQVQAVLLQAHHLGLPFLDILLRALDLLSQGLRVGRLHCGTADLPCV